MLKKLGIVIGLVAGFLVSEGWAQGNVSLSEEALRQEAQSTAETTDRTTAAKPQILSRIAEEIGPWAFNNLNAPEQVFCYQVAMPPENYTGYTLDGLAVVGFCGVINQKIQDLVVRNLLGDEQSILFDKAEKCNIQPKIMLRYVRGVDSTDLMLSAPCYAAVVFYGGGAKIFNAKPAAATLDGIINPLINNKSEFVSPALFNQTLPIGVAKTEEQKMLLQKKNEPIRQWLQVQKEQAVKTSGWNKLKSKQ
ncbi:MAG: hypothetical protein IJ529_04155 [Alphaproteobacteria bacterium]|nr:hypothetical protein [Alphaproteobacteria bacterium]MBQ9235672.1 hypothetical protein [Alphaproteobacteria bacterium]